jgi:hypothetical protein
MSYNFLNFLVDKPNLDMSTSLLCEPFFNLFSQS